MHTAKLHRYGHFSSPILAAPLIFLMLVATYFAVSYYNASLISDRLMTDKIFPMLISDISLLCCFFLFIRMIRGSKTDAIFADREASGEEALEIHGFWSILAWFGLLRVFTSLLGFTLALALFLMTFIRFRAGLDWSKAMLYTSGGITLMCFMAWMLNRDFPPGLLQSWYTLPWPLT